MILPGRENPFNCVDPDKMRMRCFLSTLWSPEFVLPMAQSPSNTPGYLYTHCGSIMMYIWAVILRVKRCTWRPGSSELRDALGSQDQVNSVRYSMAMLECIWRFTWWLRSCEPRDPPGGRDRASVEIQWEAVIEGVWRCTLRL
jgi:hypothetical protein